MSTTLIVLVGAFAAMVTGYAVAIVVEEHFKRVFFALGHDNWPPSIPKSPPAPKSPGSGTISATAIFMLGTATFFEDEIAVGDRIWIGDVFRTVVQVTTQTALTVNRRWPMRVHGLPYSIQRHVDAS